MKTRDGWMLRSVKRAQPRRRPGMKLTMLWDVMVGAVQFGMLCSGETGLA